MIGKRYIMDHIDNLYEEVNGLYLRVMALEQKEFKKDLNKLEKKPGKRGPGRPRKSEVKDAKKK